jgi:REP element-mobilizing transposase RayT
LCGKDSQTGVDYEHRRDWIEKRILKLGQVFCIDVCAYAVMSNHYHVVLHLNAEDQASLSMNDVLSRWQSLYSGNQLVKRYLREEPMCDAELQAVKEISGLWRERLRDLSWFMRALNEGIAREANFEDRCTGRFWEGRYKSQALLDEQALAACMAYVDLNPVRASMAKTPEHSSHTSAKRRIAEAEKTPSDAQSPYQPMSLFPFVGNPRESMPQGLPFKLSDYLELLDWTGRIIRDDKRGAIQENAPDILTRLNIETKNWIHSAQHFEGSFKQFAGKIESVKTACLNLGYQRIPTTSAVLT